MIQSILVLSLLASFSKLPDPLEQSNIIISEQQAVEIASQFRRYVRNNGRKPTENESESPDSVELGIDPAGRPAYYHISFGGEAFSIEPYFGRITSYFFIAPVKKHEQEYKIDSSQLLKLLQRHLDSAGYKGFSPVIRSLSRGDVFSSKASISMGLSTGNFELPLSTGVNMLLDLESGELDTFTGTELPELPVYKSPKKTSTDALNAVYTELLGKKVSIRSSEYVLAVLRDSVEKPTALRCWVPITFDREKSIKGHNLREYRKGKSVLVYEGRIEGRLGRDDVSWHYVVDIDSGRILRLDPMEVNATFGGNDVSQLGRTIHWEKGCTILVNGSSTRFGAESLTLSKPHKLNKDSIGIKLVVDKVGMLGHYFVKENLVLVHGMDGSEYWLKPSKEVIQFMIPH